MFYHVVIEIEGNKEPIYELDRTIESVIEEVMIPYLEGNLFTSMVILLRSIELKGLI